MRRQLTYLPLVAVLAGACRSAPPRPPAEFPYHDDVSFRGFAEEALFGFGTPRTPRFDDYTKGSYHVHPLELADRLPAVAATYRINLQGIAVVGPYGPLWAYDVITVVKEPACTRVNWLLMPHARITVKRTGCLSADEVSSLFRALKALATATSLKPEENTCLVVFDAGERRVAPFDCYREDGGEKLGRLDAALNRVRAQLPVTYSSYPPVEDDES